MDAEEMFDGFRFTPEVIADLKAMFLNREDERSRQAFEALEAKTRDWTPEEFRIVEQGGADVEIRLLALMRSGKSPDDPVVLDVLDDDLALQRRIWNPDADSYAALGRAFAAAPELRAHLDARDPALAAYMGDAMVAYATARMM